MQNDHLHDHTTRIPFCHFGASAAKPLATIVLSIVARGLATEAPISYPNKLSPLFFFHPNKFFAHV
jgi:hypothetical protein